jgi:hypothetical protein
MKLANYIHKPLVCKKLDITVLTDIIVIYKDINCFKGGNIVAPKKGLKDFDKNLKKAGTAIGQLLARSQAKLEERGRQALKSTGKLVDSMTKKAEETMETGVEKIHEATAPETSAKAQVASAFKPIKNKPIADSIKLLAEEIRIYLDDNGKTPVEELIVIMGRRRRNPGMFFAAVGWLSVEGKVKVTKNGLTLSIM